MTKDEAIRYLDEHDSYNDSDSLNKISKEFRADPEVVRIAVKNSGNNIIYADTKLLNDRTFILDLVSRIWTSNNFLEKLPEVYKSDKAIVMEILKNDYGSLKFASEDLRDDPEVVWQAMFKSQVLWAPYSFEFAGATILRDKEFVKKALIEIKSFKMSQAKKDISDKIKQLQKIAIASDKGSDAKEFASAKILIKNIKKDIVRSRSSPADSGGYVHKKFIEVTTQLKKFSENESLMKLLVEADYLQIPYYASTIGTSVAIISKKLINDKKFLSSLMTVTKGEVLGKLPKTIRSDASFIEQNIGINIEPEFVSEELRNEPNFLISLASRTTQYQYRLSKFPSLALRNNKEFMLNFVKIYGNYLECASPELKKDKDVVLAAFKSEPYSIVYADHLFYKDPDLMKDALINGTVTIIDELPESLLSNLPFLLGCLDGVSEKLMPSLPRAILRAVPLELKQNKTLITTCLKLNHWAIESVPEKIKYDKDVLKAAFSSYPHIYKDLDLEKLQKLFSKETLKKIINNEKAFNEFEMLISPNDH